MDNLFIISISFDGTDGVGKTTLINYLSNNYKVAELPRFYSCGAVPLDPNERRNWFLSVSQKDAMKIYLTAHKHRLAAIKFFKQGLHYKFLESSEKQKILVADRGFLSVEAFAYAALRCENEMSDDEINDFIDIYFRNDLKDFINSYFDLTVLLAGNPEDYLSQVISRRSYDQHEIDLIKYQAEYLYEHCHSINNILKLLPTNELENNKELLEKSILSIVRKKCI